VVPMFHKYVRKYCEDYKHLRKVRLTISLTLRADFCSERMLHCALLRFSEQQFRKSVFE